MRQVALRKRSLTDVILRVGVPRRVQRHELAPRLKLGIGEHRLPSESAPWQLEVNVIPLQIHVILYLHVHGALGDGLEIALQVTVQELAVASLLAVDLHHFRVHQVDAALKTALILIVC